MAAYNANYTGLAVWAAEKSVSNSWRELYTEGTPLMRMMYGGGKGANFNRGFTISKDTLRALVPIALEGTRGTTQVNQSTGLTQQREDSGTTVQVDGVTAATYGNFESGAFSGVGASLEQGEALTPYLTRGFTQAQYELTMYVGAYWTTEEERKLASMGSRGDLIDGATRQLMYGFKKKASDHLYASSAANETRSNLIALKEVFGTSNDPGGISQSTYQAWQGRYRAVGGPFSFTDLDERLNHNAAFGHSKTDFIMFSYSINNDLYGKAQAQIASNFLVQAPADGIDYGVETFKYRGRTCVLDPQLESGTCYGFASPTWYLAGSNEPESKQVQRLDSKLLEEHMFVWWCGVFCGDPGSNWSLTGMV